MQPWVPPILVLLFSLLGAAMLFERRLNGKLGIKEHEQICRESNLAVKDALQELKRSIEVREERSREHRHKLNNDVHLLWLEMTKIGRVQRKDIDDRSN